MNTKKIKYIYKAGDWTDVYVIGEVNIFKGRNRWLIIDTYYNSLKDKTTIKLEKI